MGKTNTYPTTAGLHALTHQPGGEDVIVGIAPGAHAVTHILAGIDPIIAGLDARALNLAAQGEIVYHAVGVNTLVALPVGVAGQSLLSGGPAANIAWGAPAPAAHEATHVAGGADDIDSALDARALGLTAQGEIVYHAAAANTLATLAVGVAGQALLTGGAGANVTWGAPAPAAHVLATTGPHTGTLPLTDLIVGARGEIITRTVADWAALGVGVAGQALLSGGAGADVLWGAPAPAAHEPTHVRGGTDDIDAALDARAIALANQGEIVFHAAAATTLTALATGVAGQALLTGGAGADPSWGAPAPAAHESTHVSGGADDIDSTLDGRAIALTTQGDIVYASGVNTITRLGAGVAGEALLTGGPAANPSWGAPAPAAHAPTHKDGGTDELDVAELAGALGSAGEIPESDGAAVSWVDPDGRYDPKAHVLATTGPHTNELPLTDLVAGVQGNIISRTAADWAALAVGGAGDALLSGGAGANVTWGAPAPAAHESSHVSGGADDIDSALDGRAITLTTQGDIVYASGVNTLARLAAGTINYLLKTGGPGANPSWEANPHIVGEVLDNISCALSGPFTTGAAGVTVSYTDMILNISEFPSNAKGVLRVTWKNDGNNTNNIQLYDQFAVGTVAGSQIAVAMTANVWQLSETGTPFVLPAGLKSFMVNMGTDGGTMTISKVQLQIERAV